ncbi:Cation channel sperm-associated protein 3 [Sorochytrium milnesiophthora]
MDNKDVKPETNQQVSIKLRDPHGSEVEFKVKPTTKFFKIAKAYADKKSLALGSLRFQFDGARIQVGENSEQTVSELELEDGDTVDVQLEQFDNDQAAPLRNRRESGQQRATARRGWGGTTQTRGLQIYEEIVTQGHYAERMERVKKEREAESSKHRKVVRQCCNPRRPESAKYVKRLLEVLYSPGKLSMSEATKWFNNGILLVIFANCVVIALDAQSDGSSHGTDYADDVFMGIYMLEFLLKIYAEPRLYWRNKYNLFDFVILVLSVAQFIISFLNVNIGNLTFLRVFRAMRALRSFRSVSSIRQLQVIVSALWQTLRKSVLDILACLFTFLFLFAVMGYYLFGDTAGGDPGDFGSLGRALMSLMSYVTSSGWSAIQWNLAAAGFAGSEVYSVTFMFLANFIFTNRNLTWIETYMITHYHLENSMYRCQQTHFNIANTIAELHYRRSQTALTGEGEA